jgi:hypothetical protein
MAESSLPPPPPTNNSGLLVVLSFAAILLVGGGLALWRFMSADSSEAQEATATIANTAPAAQSFDRAAAAPPPPPPPPPGAGEEAAEPGQEPTVRDGEGLSASSASAENKPASKTKPMGAENDRPSTPNNDGCSGTCPNRADAALNQALRQRGASARNCYNAALRSNPTLQGKVAIKLRISPSGSTCSASISNDTLGDPSVTSCILQKFKSGGYPKPNAGCADFEVPLSFVASGN